MKAKVFVAREGLILLALMTISAAFYGAAKFKEYQAKDSIPIRPGSWMERATPVLPGESPGPWTKYQSPEKRIEPLNEALRRGVKPFNSVEQLGRWTEYRFPEYVDLSYESLGEKILSKYPQYSTLIDSRQTAARILKRLSVWLPIISYAIYWLMNFILWAITTLRAARKQA